MDDLNEPVSLGKEDVSEQVVGLRVCYCRDHDKAVQVVGRGREGGVTVRLHHSSLTAALVKIP